MRISLFSPFSIGPARGNITTVNRIARNLSVNDIKAEIVPLDILDKDQIQDLLLKDPPDLIHAFHAFYSGPTAQKAAELLNIPYVITITGSDLFDPAFSNRPETISALEGAAAVTCFDSIVELKAAEIFPFISGKTLVIPQGVEPLSSLPAWPRSQNDFIILLPAAIRPAKGILEAIASLSPLAKILPDMKLLIVGGDIDREYSSKVRDQIALLEWVQAVGEIPHEEMGGLYSSSDLVLNSSLFEGGMPNSILEAMAMTRPVVARDIPGNRSLVKHGSTGWLYKTDDELRKIITAAAKQPDLRKSAGRAAFDYVMTHFSTQKEAHNLTDLYQQVTQRT